MNASSSKRSANEPCANAAWWRRAVKLGALGLAVLIGVELFYCPFHTYSEPKMVCVENGHATIYAYRWAGAPVGVYQSGNTPLSRFFEDLPVADFRVHTWVKVYGGWAFLADPNAEFDIAVGDENREWAAWALRRLLLAPQTPWEESLGTGLQFGLMAEFHRGVRFDWDEYRRYVEEASVENAEGLEPKPVGQRPQRREDE